MDGIDVILCNVLYSNHQGVLLRTLSFAKFALLATIALCLFVPKVDVVFATSLPLTVGIPGYVGARWHRASFVFEVRDICPESDVIAGYLEQGSVLERILAFLEWFFYVKADRILLVSPGFQKRLAERGYAPAKLRTVLLGADGSLFRDINPDTDFRPKHGLGDATLAVYTGAHGIANGLDYVLQAAELLRNRNDIIFVLIGDGNRKSQLIDAAREKNLTNIRFIDPVPKTQLPAILMTCNIGLMILRDVGERPVTPNKIFDYMFAGLPSIVNFRGPTIEMVQSDGTGLFADPSHPEELAHRLECWADDPGQVRKIGERARRIAFEKYDRWRIAEKLLSVFEETVKSQSKGVVPKLASRDTCG